MKKFTVLMAAAVAIVLTAGTAHAQQYKWDFATAFAPKTADGIAVAHFVDLVHEKTGAKSPSRSTTRPRSATSARSTWNW